MIEEQEVFEVTRAEYKEFVDQINPDYRDVRIIDIDDHHQATRIYSRITEKCLCSRVSDIREEAVDPEKYYIINIPERCESIAPQPKIQVELKTPKEVQTFIDALNRLQKEHHD